ncbi:MAG: aminotransferase class I/II-fold pyridoxal phosphate-dependent enzyme [Deltaproteobacteria bacterium]|jgi:LL-diaminopimelate aminotransferase|nr:aminotransferase class I/II-fold pyridoxal phosphate-dependent enzyme [Deltaproteobacteria bacterium]
MQIAKRMEPLKGFLVMEMNMRLAKMKQEGRDVVNLGVGDPDFNPPEPLLQALKEAVGHPDYHHYPSFYPHQPLKDAIAGWYKRRFGVDLDPNREVLSLLGSTDGLFMIHLCLLDSGDVALVPDPSYPSYAAGVKVVGGQVERVSLLGENDFLPDLDSIPTDVAKKAKMIWVNYPNNPTGATAPPEFYQKLISWAKAYDVTVVSDNAYSEVYFDNRRPVSFLEFPGAKEVGVELHSLSKSYNCCGWRAGMVVGNQDLVAALSRIKAHSDRGMFYPMQLAAINALNSSDDFMEKRNQIFQERREVLVEGLNKIGLKTYPPKATFYLWARVPEGYTSQNFCFEALEQANVWMIPGSLYGQFGEGYLRIAFTHSVERLKEAIRRLQNFYSERRLS